MSRPTPFGDNELESLLRATFTAEARDRVPDSRGIPPFPAIERLATVHPLRRRWTGISLVAAALVAFLVGALVVGEQAMDSERRPTPAGTSVAPAPTPTSSLPSTTPTAAVTTTASNPPPGTRSVTVAGVTMDVPTSWNIQPLTTTEFSRTCFVTGAPKPAEAYDPTRCVLVVRVGTSRSDGFGPDQLDVSFESVCGNASSNANFATYAGDQVTVDGEETEHRRWSTTCAQAMIDTWTVPTFPVVQFTRIGPGDAASLAAATNAVLSARLPGPRSTLRATDVGYPTAVTGNVLSLDRITAFGHTVVNDDPATYDYPIAAGATILCHTTAGQLGTLTPDQFRAEVEGRTPAGFVPVDQLYVRLVTDGSQVTQILLAPRSDLS